MYKEELIEDFINTLDKIYEQKKAQVGGSRVKHENEMWYATEDEVDRLNYEVRKSEIGRDNILQNTILNDDYVERYYKKMIVPIQLNPYVPLPKPSEKKLRKKVGCLKQHKIIEKIFKKRKDKRINRGLVFEKEWETLINDYEKRELYNKKLYEEYRTSEIEINKKINEKTFEKIKNFNNCNKREVIKVISEFLNDYEQPFESGILYITVSYDESKKAATASLKLISPDDLNNVKSYKYVKSKNMCKATYYNEREIEEIYRKVVFNSITSFSSSLLCAFSDVIDNLIVNSYVNKINPATGNYEDFYFVSVKLSKDDIPYSNLSRIDGKSFLESKKVKYSTPLVRTKKIHIYSFDDNNLIDTINNEMTGIDFENIAKELLEKNGFEKVNVTKASGDYGADVLAYKDGVKYAIQCKRYGSKVGTAAVQEVIAAVSMYKCHVGVVLTNNYFTPNAKELAKSSGILLWDAEKLQQLISNAKINK